MSTETSRTPIDFVVIYLGEGAASADEYPYVIRKRMYAGKGIIRFAESALQFADWVRNIFIVTMDMLPDAQVFQNDHIKIVSLDNFMPSSYPRTTNINAIELNLHRINGISEQFVYFNAGTFLCGKVNPSFFFRNGLPCDYAIESMFETPDLYERHILINDILQIKGTFNRNESLSYYRWKFLSPRYLRGMIQNTYFWFIRYWENGYRSRRGDFWGFEDHNYPLCTTVSLCKKIYEIYSKAIEETCSHTKEGEKDVDHSLIRFYQYASGNFAPYDWHSKTVTTDSINDIDTNKTGAKKFAVVRSQFQ